MTTKTLLPEQKESLELGLPSPSPANLADLEWLDASLDEKGTANPGKGLYPRDGEVSVSTLEGQVSRVTNRGQRKNVVWVSGMSAVRETVDFAAVAMATQGTRKGGGPVIAAANELYAQSGQYFRNERLKGANVVRFYSGDEESVAEAIDEKGADVIFAETVANAPGLPVLNVHALLRHVRALDKPPLVILDNSLLLKTGLDSTGLLRPSDKVIVVESATKNLMNNSELLGVSFSPNIGLMDDLRKHKAHSGAVNSIGALEGISAKLRLTIPGFHDRNRAVFNSTGKIAAALAEAQAELGESADFVATSPASPDHPNHDYARVIMPEGVDFISPVVFMSATDFSDSGAHNLIRRVSEHPAMREQIEEGQIHLGQSFCTPKARLLYDRDAPNVRFAGGFDLSDEDALARAVKEAAADK